MADIDRERWDKRYRELAEPPHSQLDAGADRWLREHVAELPPGRAADLACGLGGNARWLAQHGWDVQAIDISETALQLAAGLGQPTRRPIVWRAADLDDCDLTAGDFDLVCVFRFLDRQRFPGWLPHLLKPGGRLIYKTFLQPPAGEAGVSSAPRNPAHLLNPGELRSLFPLRVLDYVEAREPAGWFASLVAQR